MSGEGPEGREVLPGVDVGRIMKEIRHRVEERKRAGEYSDEDLAAIAAMELRLREREEYGVEMDRLISWLHAHWEATAPVEEEMAGGSALWRATKKLLRRLLSPLSRLLLAKQNHINARVVQLLSGALPPLREGARDVEKRMENLALRLEKENSALREEVREMSSRLDRLESSREER